MPEGDTVFKIANLVRDKMVGRKLISSDIRVPRYATVDMTGRTFSSVRTKGKHLYFEVGNYVIHSHLRMEGIWIVLKVGDRWPRPEYSARAVFTAEGDCQLIGFELGTLEILSRTEAIRSEERIGPDPLGVEWDPQKAAENLGRVGILPIGEVLLDQSKLSGLGNVYRNEICFLRGVHPGTPVEDCGDLLQWVDLASRLLKSNIDRATRVVTGIDSNSSRYYVYRRRGLPCLRCGCSIRAGLLGRRNVARRIWWCPSCQPVHP
ncbi:DNA-formamidopyrimidine glycosylase family protein [Tsukamurella serpentis]